METPAVQVLRSLADPSRLLLARLLVQGPFNVGELQDVLGLGQSTISHHLKVLVEAGLLECRREGRMAWYGWPVSLPPPQAALWAFVQEHGGTLPVDAMMRLKGVLESRTEQTRRFFDGARPIGPELGDLHAAAVDLSARIVQLLPAAHTVADLGTGDGRLLSALRSRAQRVVGVDQSPRMLAEARRRVVSEGWPDVELRLGALEHLPLADGEADAAVAHQVLHHVADPEQALREAGRVLRPGGLLLVADYLPHEREEMRESYADLWLGFDPDWVVRALQQAGMKEIRAEAHVGHGGVLGMFVVSARRPPAGPAPAVRERSAVGARAPRKKAMRSASKRTRRTAAQGAP